MIVGFFGTTTEILGETDVCVSGGQVSVQRQRSLEFWNASSGAVAEIVDKTHPHVGRGMLRR
jgi:hypothetical protein